MNAHLTAAGLQALLPLILVGATAVVVMLAISIRRHHRITAALTALGLLAALIAVPLVQPLLPQAVTPMLLLDRFATFYMALMIATALAGTLLCYGYIDRFQGNREELYLLLVLATLGACVLVCAADFSSLFVGLELLSVSLFGMVAYPVRERRALEASIKYLILSAAASAFLLFGMALVYSQVGSLSIAAIAKLLPSPEAPRNLVLLAGSGMIAVGIGFKLSLVPFHLWTPDVYEGAPAPVTGFLATVSKGAVMVLLLRLYMDSGAWRYDSINNGLSLVAILSILAGNWLALQQQNVKRILAYSSIAHFGYVLVALIAAQPDTIEAVTVYLVTYFATTLAAFGVLGLQSTPMADRDADSLWDYRGLFWRRPYLTVSFTVALLSLAGIPLTAGFIGKFFIISAGIEAKLWLLLAVVVIGSAIGLYYYLRVMITLYLPSTRSRDVRVQLSRPQQVMGLAMLGLTALVVFMGAWPAPLIALTRAMAATMQ